MVDFFFNSQLQIFLQLFLAAVLGGVIGLEREYKRKEAGVRTFALVCLGATLFTVVGFESFSTMVGNVGVSFDPSRITQAIAMGIGFLGGGMIIVGKFGVEGLTTAAGLWVAAAVGLAIGIELYWVAVFTASLMVGILAGVRVIEGKWLRTKPGGRQEFSEEP